jgi:hypothetical protein
MKELILVQKDSWKYFANVFLGYQDFFPVKPSERIWGIIGIRRVPASFIFLPKVDEE